MQLNNKTTGEIIKIVAISESGIAYDSNISGRNSVKSTIDKTKVPTYPTLSIIENENQMGYDVLLTFPEFLGFEKSEDVKNWQYRTKPYRLVCDTAKVYEHLIEQTQLGQTLVSLLAAFVGQIFKVGDKTYIYMSTLEPYQDVDVNVLISTYPDTFLRIENK